MNPLTLLSPVAGVLFGRKKPKPSAPVLQPRVDTAAEAAQNRDLLSKRKGAAANQLTGKMGAESGTGKTNLGL
tara:strand:+ start:596 stop:814 length:219 start_codon:yes stop_codon:yes gene_type:complete